VVFILVCVFPVPFCVLPEHHDVKEMVLSHMAALDRLYPRATKWVFIEANMSYIGADQVAGWCLKFEKVVIESKDPSPRQRVGVWTGPAEKESYAWTLRDIVSDRSLFFASRLIGRNVDRDVGTLVEQLRAFRMERLEPSDPAFGKFKYAYTAKTPGGTKDDLVLALMIATHWGRRKRGQLETLAWADQCGIRLR
jgi:hypothetical protein